MGIAVCGGSPDDDDDPVGACGVSLDAPTGCDDVGCVGVLTTYCGGTGAPAVAVGNSGPGDGVRALNLSQFTRRVLRSGML